MIKPIPNTLQLFSQEPEGYAPTDLQPWAEQITITPIPQEDWPLQNSVRFFNIPNTILKAFYQDYLCNFGSTLDYLTKQGELSATQYEELIPDYICQLIDLGSALDCQNTTKNIIKNYLESHEDTKTLAQDAGILL